MVQPMRAVELKPDQEVASRAKQGATWTMGFVRGDLFYNEEEAQTMRSELGSMYRAME